MTPIKNPYRKRKAEDKNSDGRPVEVSIPQGGKNRDEDMEEEAWIMGGFPNKYEWAFESGLIDFDDYVDEGYPTPPRDEYTQDEEGTTKDESNNGECLEKKIWVYI